MTRPRPQHHVPRRTPPLRAAARLVYATAAILAGLTPLHAQAQEDDDSTTDQLPTTTALFLLEEGATNADAAVVTLGLRRGIRDVEGLRFRHPVDLLSAENQPEEVYEAIQELDPIADMVRSGDPRAAARQADRVADVFERHLTHVSRARLVDAYMLAALARCRVPRARNECQARLTEIFAFRERLTYDPVRYPEELQPIFDEVRDVALAGDRGTVIIDSVPPGAEVYVDGQSYGPSPATVDGLLDGFHYVTLKELTHRKVIQRIRVEGNQISDVRVILEPNERSALVSQPATRDALRGVLGSRNGGDPIRQLSGTLGTDQVIVGVLRPAAGGRVHVQLYLYHSITRLLQAQAEATLSVDEAGMERARQIALELYEGVDLSGTIAAPENELVGGPPELIEQWWFWTAIAGGVLAVILGSWGIYELASNQDGPPAGWLRFRVGN